MPPAIEIWSIDRLVFYARNPRKNDAAVDKMCASIREFGFKIPVLARSTGEVVDGHLRLKAAKKLGITEIPVILCDEWTEAQVKAFRLLVNRSVAWADWDDSLLTLELQDLKTLDFELSLTGFEPKELNKLLSLGTGPDERANVIPPVPTVPVTQAGDLWLLGEHRLLCGDSRSKDAVSRLCGGERAGLMNTDPPYGVSYANDERPNPGVAKPRVANDSFKDDELQSFLESAFHAALSALKENAAWYLWHAHLTQGFFAAAAAAAAAHVILHRQIIWVKPVLLLGRGQYHWKHEPCFMGWVEGHRPPDYGRGGGERDQTTIWEIAGVNQKDRKEFNHSTPKPVELFEIPIVKHLKKGEACYEPFAGSGPQVIAAEKHGVRCFAMELEPRFCDVIVARWSKYTGKQAILESTGQTFAETKEARSAVAA